MADESVILFDRNDSMVEPIYDYDGPVIFSPNFTLRDSVDLHVEALVSPRFIPFEAILALSVVGICLNLLNIFVFTRKSMISPINILLSSFEAANVMFFVSFILQSIEYVGPQGYVFTWRWVTITRSYPYIRLASACASNWLAVTIGIWRCIGVGFPLVSHICLTKRTARVSIVAIVVASSLLAIPDILITSSNEVTALVYDDNNQHVENLTLYVTQINENYDHDILFMTHNSVTLIVSFVPCLLLSFATVYLVFCLCRASRRRKQLSETKSACSREECLNSLKDQALTTMLLVVLVTFVLSYLPDAICVVILMIHYRQFTSGEITWNPSGTCKTMIMDGLYPIISNAFTFFIYYFMSQNFRNTFHRMLGSIFTKRKLTSEMSTSSTATKAETVI